MAIKAIITDFSRVILFPRDPNYVGSLNKLHDEKHSEENYNFWQYFSLNSQLLDYFELLKQKYEIYLFTTGKTQEYSGLRTKLFGLFEQVFTVEDLGIEKNRQDAYTKLADKIGRKTDEILFVDDRQENLDAAKLAGMSVCLFVNNQSLVQFINQL